MIIEQISIFLENKPGRLSEVTSLLAKANISIRALSLADTSDFGILRLILDDTEKASAILKENSITVRISKVLAIEIPDQPGGLHDTLTHLANHGINIEYMYAFVQKAAQSATLVFRATNIEEALACLEKK